MVVFDLSRQLNLRLLAWTVDRGPMMLLLMQLSVTERN